MFQLNKTYRLSTSAYVVANDDYMMACQSAALAHGFNSEQAVIDGIPEPQFIVPASNMPYCLAFSVNPANPAVDTSEPCTPEIMKAAVFTITGFDEDGDPTVTCKDPETGEIEQVYLIQKDHIINFVEVTLQ